MIVRREKTTSDYIKRLESLTKNTRENRIAAINNFKNFLSEKHRSSPEQISKDLKHIKNTKGEEEFEDVLYDILQQWIDWNNKKKLGAYTIKTRLSIIRGFLYYLGIKTEIQDIKHRLEIPKRNKDVRYPIKIKEIRDLVLTNSRTLKRQALYLACSSGGIRIGEGCNVRKKDLDFSLERMMIYIHALESKTHVGRIVFVSKECQEKILMYYNELKEDDYVFTSSKAKDVKDRQRTEQMAFARTRRRLGYNEKYESNGINKITTHSFRAFYFTKAARAIGEDYAQIMTGHGGYLLTEYDRMTNEEKLEQYLKLEPELVVFEQTKNELKIKQLESDNKQILEIERKMKVMEGKLAEQDKIIIEQMRNQGKIPTI